MTLDFSADAHGNDQKQHTDREAAERVENRIARQGRHPDREQRQAQTECRSDVFAQHHQQFAAPAPAEPAPQRVRAAQRIDLDETFPQRDRFGGQAERQHRDRDPRIV